MGVKKYTEAERILRIWEKACDEAKRTVKNADKRVGNDVKIAGNAKYSYDGKTKSGIRKYISDFPKNMSKKQRVDTFKNRLETIFNLGAVELKTDIKKIVVNADKFTTQKNLFGDKNASPNEMIAKINSLYDLVDILNTSKYVGKNTENSYIDNSVQAKNNAHKGVKYWYTFSNRVYLMVNCMMSLLI